VHETKKVEHPTQPTETTANASPAPVTAAPTGEISVGMDQSQAARDRALTNQLLQSTDENLKKINRTLTPDETSMVQQIKAYEEQSRTALAAGDLGRASNLALKAHLLSDALTK
jgi:hypothetical protein